ncbi:MAG: hypothetical protein ACOCUH_04320 [Bacteriovoracia bacterium]
MNTKICPECGITFEAKRSDATCCSDKCRSAFNYKRKERRKQNLQIPLQNDLGDNFQNEAELNGKLEMNHLIGKIESFENHVLRIQDEIKTFEGKNENLNQQMTALNQQIVMLEAGEKLKLKKRAEMTDYALYNNYLNVAYQKAKKNGDQFAKTRLVTEEVVQSRFNCELKLEIQNYRSGLSAKLEKLNLELQVVQDQFDGVKNMQEQYIQKIKELHNELRFYEARILKYESLLTG